uniref:BAT2_N domain-containing protein n=1 Tax=Strongyloides papillosus TaxID=174720 RepID=A0A0N5BRK9_STREA
MSFSSKNSGGVKPHKGTNITQIYGGKNNTTSKITGNTKLGSLQSTSKVNGSIRRLPNIATLPSLKSESSGSELTPVSSSGNNGWNKQQTLKKNTTSNKVSDLRPRWAKVTSTPSNDSGIQINGHQDTNEIPIGSLSNAPLKEFPSLADSVGKIKNGNDDGNSLFPEAPPPSTAIGGYIRAKPVSYKNERKLPDRYCATAKPSYCKSEKFDLNKKLAEVRDEEERRKKEETRNCNYTDDQKGDEKENSEVTVKDKSNYNVEGNEYDTSKEPSYPGKYSSSNEKSQNGYESYGYSSKSHLIKANDLLQNYQDDVQDDKHNYLNESSYDYNIDKKNTCHSINNSSIGGSFPGKTHGTVRIAKRGEDFGQHYKSVDDESSELRPITSITKIHENEYTKSNTKTICGNEKHTTKLLQNIVDMEKKPDRKDHSIKPAPTPPVNIWAKRAEEREQAEKERLKQLELMNAAEQEEERKHKGDYNNKHNLSKTQNDNVNNSSKASWKNKELGKKVGANTSPNENVANYRSSKRYNKEEGYNSGVGKRFDNKKTSDEKEFDSYKRYGSTTNSNSEKSAKIFPKGGNRFSGSTKGRNAKHQNSKKQLEGGEDVDSDSSEVINYGRLNRDGVKATYYKREDSASENQKPKKGTQSEKVWNNNKESTNNYRTSHNNIEGDHQKATDDNNKTESQTDTKNNSKIEGSKTNISSTGDSKVDNSGKKEISEQDMENLKNAVDNITEGNSSPIPTAWSNGDNNFDECITMKSPAIHNTLEDTINNQLDCSNTDNRINYDSTNGPFGVDSMNDIFGFPGNATTGFESSFSGVNKSTSSKSGSGGRQQIQDNGRVPVQSTNLQQANLAPPAVPPQESIGIHPSQGSMDVFGYNQMNMLMPNDLFGRPFQTQYTNYSTNGPYSQGNNIYYDPRQNNQWNSTTNSTNTYNTTNTDTINNRTTSTNNSRNNVGNQQTSTNYSQQVGNRQQRNNNTQHQQQFHFMPTFPQYPGHDYFRNQPAPQNLPMNYTIPPAEINSTTHPYSTIIPPMLGSQNYQPNQYQFPPPIHGPSPQVQGNTGYNNNQRSSHGRQNNGLDDFSNWNMFLSTPNMIPTSQILQTPRGNGQNLHYTAPQQNSATSRQNFLNNTQNSGNLRNNPITNRGNSENPSSNRWNSTNNSSNTGNKHTH